MDLEVWAGLGVVVEEGLVREAEEGFWWRYLPIWGFEGGVEDGVSEGFIILAALPRADVLTLAFLSRC